MQLSIVLVATMSLLVAGVSAENSGRYTCDCNAINNGGNYYDDGERYYDYDYAGQTEAPTQAQTPAPTPAVQPARKGSQDSGFGVGIRLPNLLDPLGVFSGGRDNSLRFGAGIKI